MSLSTSALTPAQAMRRAAMNEVKQANLRAASNTKFNPKLHKPEVCGEVERVALRLAPVIWAVGVFLPVRVFSQERVSVAALVGGD